MAFGRANRKNDDSNSLSARPIIAEDLLRTPDDDNRNILRHCERSEVIHASTLDCFVPRNDGAAGRLYEPSYFLFALLKVEYPPRNNSAGDGEDLWYIP
jgi:hypothetical protein